MRIFLVLSIILTISAAIEWPRFVLDAYDSVSSLFSPSKLVDHSKLKYISNISTFEEFKDQAARKYEDSSEEEKRRQLFYENLEFIKKHNERFARGETSYALDTNFFFDFKPSDILEVFTGIRKSARGTEKANSYASHDSLKFDRDAPAMVNWVENGAISRIKYQGECKAGWAFAATGAVEGHIHAKTNILLNLSEQELIDCSESHHNEGCKGGFHDYAFAYITENGISTDDEYPYIGDEQTCKVSKETTGKYYIHGFRKISPGDERELKEVVGNLGPVACAMNAVPGDFLFFKNGIYNNPQCHGDSPQHSVLIVGYGESKGEPYWLIKNSWGQTWGNTHYAGIPRNVNFCGIASECSYPIIKESK